MISTLSSDVDAAHLSHTCHILSTKQLQVASGHCPGQRRYRCPKYFSSLKSSNLTQIYLDGAHYGSLFSDTHCVILIYRFKFSCSVRTFFLKYCFWHLFHSLVLFAGTLICRLNHVSLSLVFITLL